MTPTTIKIDIVSDVACPWCYVGKRRLEEALLLWKETPVVVEWQPFQLDPSMPREGKFRDDYLVSKFGDLERTKQMTQTLEEVGKEVGIKFNFGERWLAVNTLPLHQLLEVAGAEGFKNELKERFFKAYFEDQVPLNDLSELTDIVNDFGWTQEKVSEILNDAEVIETVKSKMTHFQNLGVTGVPFFIINNKYAISGAQPAQAIVNALRQVSQEQNPAPIGNENHCDVTGEDC